MAPKYWKGRYLTGKNLVNAMQEMVWVELQQACRIFTMPLSQQDFLLDILELSDNGFAIKSAGNRLEPFYTNR